MNGNLSFSKNVFGGNTETKIAGDHVVTYSQDGGRRSLDEVREDQLKANLQINPDAGKEFQVDKPEEPYKEPVDSASLTGGIATPNANIGSTGVYEPPINSSLMTGAFTNNPNSSMGGMPNNGQMPASVDSQMDATRSRIQSMQNINRNGF